MHYLNLGLLIVLFGMNGIAHAASSRHQVSRKDAYKYSYKVKGIMPTSCDDVLLWALGYRKTFFSNATGGKIRIIFKDVTCPASKTRADFSIMVRPNTSFYLRRATEDGILYDFRSATAFRIRSNVRGKVSGKDTSTGIYQGMHYVITKRKYKE